MFATTFLGHQGWVFQTERTCLLVDPLLCEEFGQAHALTYRVYPPRLFSPEAFPRVDAVILTHEHDDHFDIPSLAKLDRRIPIFLSSRSSMAAYQILCVMGFQVNPLVPGVAFEVGDLQVLPLCGDHINTNSGDEWDTLPFLIRQAEGAGSFFSMVDCTLTAAHITLARTHAPRPGLVGWTNNAQDWSHMLAGAAERTDGTQQSIVKMRDGFKLLSSLWGKPSAMLMCAGGFSFTGPRAALNHRVFCVDADKVCKTVSAQSSGQRFVATRPGQTFLMENNQLKKVEPQAPFLTTTPPETWPSREKTDSQELSDYTPATGHRELPESQVPLLRHRLNELAGALVGGTLFRSLFSLLEIEADGRMITFALVLRHGEQQGALVFMYNPNTCTFEPAPVPNPREAFLAGFECWATDLLAVLGGELGAIALMFGRARLWNALPVRFNFDLFGELHRLSHPLRRPAEYLRTYERLLQGCADVKPTILAR